MKTNKLWSIFMVLTLVLGTAIAFSSCSKDNDGDDNNPDINVPGGNDVTPSTKLQAVDLGLSVKWANMNVGAKTPEEYGDYFAWGETEPYYTTGHSQDDPCSNWKAGKESGYKWASYKWCNGSSVTLTKYCKFSDCGKVDNKTTLDPEDDAAHVNLGGSWRMPTQAEIQELWNTDNCTWTWITQNGVTGYKVTSKKNGNSIFLPASGGRWGTGIDDTITEGVYWSSSLSTYKSHYKSDVAFYLWFNSNNRGSGDYQREDGFAVRAVCP